jgi:hypothetical protein
MSGFFFLSFLILKKKEMADTNTTTNPETVTLPTPNTPPAEMYCLSCRRNRPVKDVKLVDTEFNSKKSHTLMKRKTWLGTCECGKQVRQFAKSGPKAEEPPKVINDTANAAPPPPTS